MITHRHRHPPKQNATGGQSPEKAQKLWASSKGSMTQHSIHQNVHRYLSTHIGSVFGGLAALYVRHL